jgi:hypothetical protein
MKIAIASKGVRSAPSICITGNSIAALGTEDKRDRLTTLGLTSRYLREGEISSIRCEIIASEYRFGKRDTIASWFHIASFQLMFKLAPITNGLKF